MIDMSEMIHDSDFEQDIIIERTSGGHFEKSQYVPNTTIIQTRGILVNPKNSREVIQTEQGDIAAGYVQIYVDPSMPIYVTRDNSTDTDDENNISDIIIDNYGETDETRYRVTNVFDRSRWGFFEAWGQKVGASG